MGLIYKIMDCGCIYSAGIYGSRACDPTISYCCLVCNEEISIEGYKENLNALQMDLEAFDVLELLQEDWLPSSFVKEHIRANIGKIELEKMWENAQDIVIKYKLYVNEMMKSSLF
jgi:hypothetical protein